MSTEENKNLEGIEGLIEEVRDNRQRIKVLDALIEAVPAAKPMVDAL